MKKRRKDKKVAALMEWFKHEVSYEGSPYVIDYEQTAAVVDDSLNTIVVARAGSGKTRTIVAKIVYLVAKCGVRSDEIMVFVFNANAAREINERLVKMRVGGEVVIGDTDKGVVIKQAGRNGAPTKVVTINKVQVASTFHAFARKVVYEVCGGEKKCGRILAGEKEDFILMVVREMIGETMWGEMVWRFVRGDWCEMAMKVKLSEPEVVEFASMMGTFINRAQQRCLGGEKNLAECAREHLNGDISEREKMFVELGVECFRRYHRYLLDEKARSKLCERWNEGEFLQYGTDFNLLVSWASKLIMSGRKGLVELLADKKYILIDEYQDFSQLFLAAVEAIRSVAVDSRLFVVGDDWQAINRFAGSDVEYFKEFEKFFNGERLVNIDGVRCCARYGISTNYRCDREIVEMARRFMARAMKEKGNFRAFSRRMGRVIVVNPEENEVGYALVPYDLRVSAYDRILREAAIRMGSVVMKKSMVQYLKTVVEIIRENASALEILILHRNNETNMGGVSLTGFGEGLKWGLDRLGIMAESEFENKVQLMTMHKSKGLEAEVVIILEADEGVIPKTHPDTILYGLFGETEEAALLDQKRLFYVAMTRAKKRLYIISKGGGFMKHLDRGVFME